MDAAWLVELWQRGVLIDVALAVLALEAAALFLWRWRAHPFGPLDVVGQLLAGGILLLAVRTAVTGAHPGVTALLLMASFPAHVFDLWRRLADARRRAASEGT